MKFLILKARHWQLFIIFFIIPLIIEDIPFTALSVNAIKLWHLHSVIPLHVLLSFFLFVFVLMIVVLIWCYSISIGLQNKVPKEIEMRVKRYKRYFYISLFIVPINMILVYFVIMHVLYVQTMPNDSMALYHLGFLLLISFITLPIHLFSMFSLFYQIYFAAKTLKTVELQREVSFAECANEFILFWFFPIGMWFLQPRINKIMKMNGLS